MEVKKIDNWNQVSYYYYDCEQIFETPNGTRFKIIKNGCDYYGNPSYKLFLYSDEFVKLCNVKSSERMGRLYRSKGYLYFTSYNVGYELERLFKKCEIITDLEPHELNK